MTTTSFDPIPPVVSEIQTAFTQMMPPNAAGPGGAMAASSVPGATDPFSVLLDAAQTSGMASTLTSSGSNAASSAVGAAAYEPLVESSLDPSSSTLAGASGAGASGAGAGASGTSASGSAVVAEAAAQIGVPYVWGGTTPTQGFDCSGLVQYTFAQLGVALPRTAAEQEQVGTPVASLAQAQPGDLLFFEPGQNGAPAGEAGHVAIYIGNDQMIAAPRTGQDVEVQTVPGTPLAIRRVSVPEASGAATTAATSSALTGSVQLGNVSVPAAYAGLVEQASASTGTPAALLAAILEQESGYNPDAVSSTGAEGIAQVEPGTAAANGIEPFDPGSAITGAARLLAGYHSAFGSWSLAAAAYNAGPGAVEDAGGIPQNRQTVAYVQNVMAMAGMGGTA